MARPRFEALAVGDAILDIVTPPLPQGGSGDRQSRVAGFSFLPGGNATNFALAFAALGGRSRFVGSVGKDWAAEVLRAAYRRGRVDARLRVAPARPTGMTVAVTSADATRHLITALGANAGLKASDVPPPWIAGARHLHRAGYWWATGLMGAPTAKLLARAHRAGATTSLDTATDPEGWPATRRESVLAVLPHVDTYFGTAEEICAVVGVTSLEAAADEVLKAGVKEVVVHEGARGSSVFTRSGASSAPAFPVDAANPTGCGDVFNAAYVLGTMAGMDWGERLRFANAAGAWHVENVARPYPTERDLQTRFDVRR